MPVILGLDPSIPHLRKLKDTRVKPEYDDTFAEEAVGRILESDKIAEYHRLSDTSIRPTVELISDGPHPTKGRLKTHLIYFLTTHPAAQAAEEPFSFQENALGAFSEHQKNLKQT
ncbi:hypothetical protein [Neisseria canis]|uniref:Uncharacterized protein n=1 Tax=Neisseria canis TaxID=493 RepID=A0A1X3CXV8_9NEIS|nr:hypothetical protein [Neisseria canis]OSI12365.1 hypothetical protein BWD07_05920 [Neisseria canis]VEF01546.1 Uncharacterised protein [Neisseria canis]